MYTVTHEYIHVTAGTCTYSCVTVHMYIFMYRLPVHRVQYTVYYSIPYTGFAYRIPVHRIPVYERRPTVTHSFLNEILHTECVETIA